MGMIAWRNLISIITVFAFMVPLPASAEWKYKISKNEWLNQNNYYAWVNSTNRLSDPYSSGTPAHLSLVQYDWEDIAISMSIDGGKFSCNHCEITIRFDNSNPQVAWAYLHEYGSADTLYFRGTRDDCLSLSQSGAILNMINKLKAAKSVSIKATVSNEGDKVFEFKTSGLKWPLK